MKKSFLVHVDSLNVLDQLTDEQAGQLLKAFRDYHTSGEIPAEFWLKLCITPFVNQWERDEEKWEKTAERRRESGRKGGLSKSKQMVANATFAKQPLANQAVNGNVNVNVNGNVNGNVNRDIHTNGKISSKKSNSLQKFIPPTLEEVIVFFTANGYPIAHATHVFNYYHDASWKDAKGQQVRNWKQKMRGVWFDDKYKSQEKSINTTYAPITTTRP